MQWLPHDCEEATIQFAINCKRISSDYTGLKGNRQKSANRMEGRVSIETPMPPAKHDREIGETGVTNDPWFGLLAIGPPMRRFMDQMTLAAECSAPTTIVAESTRCGVHFARCIYRASHSSRQFALLHAAALTGELLEARLCELLDVCAAPESSESRNRSTMIVLVAPERLERSLQRLIAERQDSSPGRPRWIAIDDRRPEDRRRMGEFERAFAEQMATLVIEAPPLRDRLEDLPALVQHLLAKDRGSEESPGIEPAAMEAIARYDWPGGIEELELALQTARQRSAPKCVAVKDLPHRIRNHEEPPPRADRHPPPLEQLLADVEDRMIQLALHRFGGNKARAAAYLGISRARMIRAAGRARLTDRRQQGEDNAYPGPSEGCS